MASLRVFCDQNKGDLFEDEVKGRLGGSSLISIYSTKMHDILLIIQINNYFSTDITSCVQAKQTAI